MVNGVVVRAALMLWLSVPLVIHAQDLTLRASSAALTVDGVTPKGEVVFGGVSVLSDGGVRRERLVARAQPDTDGDGRVTCQPPDLVPRRSVWVAVDLASGRFATVAGPGYGAHHVALSDRTLKKNTDGLVEQLEVRAVEMSFLVVRPGGGAWVYQAREGAAGDEDRATNDSIRATLANARPVDERFGSAPRHLRNGDVLVIFDRNRLRVGVTTIGK